MSDHDEKPAKAAEEQGDTREGGGETGNRLRRALPQEAQPAASAAGEAEAPARQAPAPATAGEARGKPEPERGPEPQTDAEPRLTGRQRLAQGVWPPRVTRAQLIVAVLLFGLGFGLAVQVASNSDSDSALRGARQEDLVRILDELDDRTQRLEDEKQGLEKQRDELENSSDQAEEARKQTVEKERQLGVLAGTVAARGPGITMTIEDTKGTVEADMLLDAIQELRAAGAEAIQVNGVRVVAGTYLTDSGKGVAVDGNKINAPYRFKVIGKPQDLEPALNIPGGVVQTLEKEQAAATIERSTDIVVDALRAAKRPDYARSSSQ
ncbi:DUF881 domain-containing protein [Streptomyces sp. NPDC101110]|uniref:DUF881 domain-containing protein n=1 Tax=unclassified Streptomyces TaxID=2593676 RepID=UPI00381593D5